MTIPSASGPAGGGASGFRAARWLRPSALAGAGLITAAAAMPFFVGGFVLFQLTMAACYGIGILGLKLLTGYNGQFSFGHSVFFAIGAYTTAALMRSGVDFYLTIPAAALAAFALGFLMGWPALRIKGHYLGLVTFVLVLAAPQILRSSLLEPWTGGNRGIRLPRTPVPIGGLSSDQWWYIVAVTVAIAMAGLAVVLVRSRLGRAMQASRDHPIAARAVGINVALVNTIAFGISAAYAGIGGALVMPALRYVGPESFSLTLAIGLFLGVIVTGPRSIPGAFISGLFIFFVPNWAEGVAQELTWAIYGIALLVVLYVMSGGGRTIVDRVGRRWRHAAPAPPTTAPSSDTA